MHAANGGTAMSKQRVLSFVLAATLLAGCATHRPPAPADGRAPGGG
jgi:hypothetical protein